MAELNYESNHQDGEQSFDVLPAGEYSAIIEASDYVDNKQGTGRILKLTYQIIDGPGECKGRKIFENLNLENASDQAAQIAKRSLNSICAACGIAFLKDSEELHNIPMIIDVRVKDSAEYGKQNRIAKHSPMDGVGGTAQAAETPAPAPAKSATPKSTAAGGKAGARPWEKKK